LQAACAKRLGGHGGPAAVERDTHGRVLSEAEARLLAARLATVASVSADEPIDRAVQRRGVESAVGGFAEDLPAVGSTVCSAGTYARKHVPWANFSNVPPGNSMPFSAFPPPGNYASLPTLSFVIPNNDNNMHDGSIAQGDAWLNRQLSAYATWAKANNSVLIVTWDEDDGGSRNQIPTVFYGAYVHPGIYPEQINHYNVLSTLEQMYGLPKTGNATNAAVITDIWGG